MAISALRLADINNQEVIDCFNAEFAMIDEFCVATPALTNPPACYDFITD
jgi:hypothetical protein